MSKLAYAARLWSALSGRFIRHYEAENCNRHMHKHVIMTYTVIQTQCNHCCQQTLRVCAIHHRLGSSCSITCKVRLLFVLSGIQGELPTSIRGSTSASSTKTLFRVKHANWLIRIAPTVTVECCKCATSSLMTTSTLPFCCTSRQPSRSWKQSIPQVGCAKHNNTQQTVCGPSVRFVSTPEASACSDQCMHTDLG